MKHLGRLLAVAAAVGLTAGAFGAPAAKAKLEARVFLFDKETMQPVKDISDINATLQIETKDGIKKSLPMEVAHPKAPREDVPETHPGMQPGEDREGAAEPNQDQGEMTPDQDRGTAQPGQEPGATPEQERDAMEPELEHGQERDQAQAQMHPGKVCGQIKEMDRWLVELVVVPAEEGMPGKAPVSGNGSQDYPEQERALDPEREAEPGMEQPDIQRQESQWLKAYVHDHQGPYFRVALDPEIVAVGKPINFTADVVFMIEGETKTAKGFEYPIGLYTEGLQRLIDQELGLLRANIESNRLNEVSSSTQKIVANVEALPALEFADAQMDLERVKQDCVTACREIESGAQSGDKDKASEALDRCEEKLNELVNLAEGAEGARMETR